MPADQPRAEFPLTVPELLPRCVLEFERLREELRLPLNCCVLAAYTLHGVLKRLGFRSHVVGVEAAALNKPASDHLLAGQPAHSLPGDAHLIGVEGTDTIAENLWDGHAVVIASRPSSGRTQRWLLDPTAGQFSRPQYGIETGPIVTDATPGFLDCSEELFTSNSEQATTLVYNRRPDMTGHRELASADEGATIGWFVDELLRRLQP